MEAKSDKTVLIVSLSSMHRDPRVLRQARTLKCRYRVVLAGFGEYQESGLEFISLGTEKNELIRNMKTRLRDAFIERNVLYRLYQKVSSRIPIGFRSFHTRIQEFLLLNTGYAKRIEAAARGKNVDLIIANDFSSLVPVQRGIGARPLLYDAHEYTPGQITGGERVGSRRIFVEYVLRKYLPRCASVTTVGEGIAREYEEVFGIPRPVVVLNAPQFVKQDPSESVPDRIRLVHHGVASRQRFVEEMIRTADFLDDRFELDLYLLHGDEEYYRELKDLCRSKGGVKLLEPVPMDQLTVRLNEYDIGIYILAPHNFNQLHALPNKFFEFVQGRLAVVIGPSPEMAAYVRKYDLGVVAEDFTAESLAKSLNALTREDILRFKRNADKHAYELSAEPQMEKLKSIVESLIGK